MEICEGKKKETKVLLRSNLVVAPKTKELHEEEQKRNERTRGP
jgi:hypothetical protein